MNTRDFTFDLPEELIAQFPSSERGKDRLMLLDRSCGDLSRCTKDYLMEDLPDLIDEGTLMVFNDSKVRRARIFGNAKDSGAKCQFLLLKNLGENRWLAMVNHAKRQRIISVQEVRTPRSFLACSSQSFWDLAPFSSIIFLRVFFSWSEREFHALESR